MFRGLDSNAAVRSGYEPPVVELADADALEVTVSVYVHESPSSPGHRRFVAARKRLQLLAEAGVVEAARFVAWPARVALPAEGEGAAVRSLYRSFADTAGTDAIEPFFEHDDELVVPELAVAVRRDGELTGLYPRSTESGVESVEDGVSRLQAGGDVENLSKPACD